MSDKTGMNFSIPEDVIGGLVREKVSAAIARELGDPAEIIERVVSQSLALKVNSDGMVSKSSYDNKYNFIEVMAGKFIRTAAHEALQEYFADNKSAIKEAVKKEVARSPAKLAKVFMDGITESMESKYGSRVEIVFKPES